MSDENNTNDAANSEGPASTDAGNGAENSQTENNGAGGEGAAAAGADNTNDQGGGEGGKPTGFKGAFAAAREAATGNADDEGGGSEEDNGDEGGDESSQKKKTDTPDDKIPDEKDKDKTDEDESTDQADDKGDKKQNDRTRKHAEVLAENEKLVTENKTATERVEKLNEQFEKHGGVEVVETAMEIFDKLADGKALEVIKELPARVRTEVQKSIFDEAISQEGNRVYGVNHVLKTDFGLEKEMSQPVLEKVFEFVTHRLNTDADDFEAMLDRELEFANDPKKQLERLTAENERLKNPPEKKEEGTTDKQESELEVGVRVEKAYNDFEEATFTAIADKEFATFGLKPTPQDTPAIREAKEFLMSAIRNQVGFDMRSAKAFEPLLGFWLDNDTEGRWFKQAAENYSRAMKGKVQGSLKLVSKLFVGTKAKAPEKPAGQGSGDPKDNKIPAPGGSAALPTAKPGQSQTGGGFKGAFAAAREAAGTADRK